MPSSAANFLITALTGLSLYASIFGAEPNNGQLPPQEPQPEMRIAARPQNVKPREASSVELAALVKRVEKSISVDGIWEKSADATAFCAESKDQPELFMRLLIPPAFPQAVPQATKDIRIRVTRILGIGQDRRAMLPLLNSCVYDPEDAVRLSAAKALALLEEPIAMRKLGDIAMARDYIQFPWTVRKCACQALRRYGDKEVMEWLLRELGYEMAGGNARDSKNKLRGSGSGLGTDNPLGIIQDNPPDLHLSEQDQYPVLSAIKEITGKNFGTTDKDFKTWLQWWDKNSDKFTFKD